MTSEIDALAMQRLARGEDSALNEIMDRWQDRLVSYLWHMTHDHYLSSDLAQETFVRVYQSRHSYRPQAPFAGYLFRIARNLLFNHGRWISRHPVESLQFLAEEGFDPSADALKPDEVLVGAEVIQEVRQAISALPEDLREIFVLFTYQELSYRQLASVFKCSDKAIETRIYRARQLLKDKLVTRLRE